MTATGITVAQAEKSESSSVWVLNTSGERGKSKGIINISIVEGNGRTNVVRVPVTGIPIDLTTQATKSALLVSPDFRRLVQQTIIRIISDADAESLLASPAAKEEQRRLLDIDHQHEIQDNQMSTELQSAKAEIGGEIGGLAMHIAHTTDGDEEAVAANLRNNADGMTQRELQYIVNNSTMHKVKATAAGLIVS